MGRHGLVLITYLLATVTAFGAEIPPRIEAFLEQCETSRRGAILLAEQRLRALRSGEQKTATSARQISRAEEELRLLRANRQPYVPPLRFPPEAGAIGRLPRLSCHVDQVLSESEMIVRCFFTIKVVSVERFQARSDSVVRPVTFVLRGLPTKDVMEGADLPLAHVFEVAVAENYRTADGRTLSALGLREFDMKALESHFQSFKAARTAHP